MPLAWHRGRAASGDVEGWAPTAGAVGGAGVTEQGLTVQGEVATRAPVSRHGRRGSRWSDHGHHGVALARSRLMESSAHGEERRLRFGEDDGVSGRGSV